MVTGQLHGARHPEAATYHAPWFGPGPCSSGRATGASIAAVADAMPMGTRHEVVGLLLEDRGQLALDVEGGGTWRLDAGWKARRLLGRRVRVTGIRDGFDLLAVETIERI